MFKQASKLKLRFQVPSGTVSTEQLWDMSLPALDKLTVALETASKRTAKKSFLTVSSPDDKEATLKFKIALAILEERVEELEASKNEESNKRHNAKIDALIAEKQDESLKSKTIEELEAMRKGN